MGSTLMFLMGKDRKAPVEPDVGTPSYNHNIQEAERQISVRSVWSVSEFQVSQYSTIRFCLETGKQEILMLKKTKGNLD